MLTLRQPQIDALNRLSASEFERRMLAYLAKTYPERVKPLPAATVSESIREGMNRAMAYGISLEYDVARFIDLMYLVSPDFDSNPRTPWVSATLQSDVMSAHARMDVVYERLIETMRPSTPEDEVAFDGSE